MPDHPGWGLQQGDEIAPGRYALSLLGGGNHYEAYLAWDTDLYTIVVVKVLRPHLVDDERARRKLAREARTARRLSHPILIRCFDAVFEGPRPHLVLEHVEGSTLSSMVRKGPLLPESAIRLALRMCSALHYMATREVLHLDVKPRNIVVGANPRLIDFSIARSFEEAKRLKTAVGTDEYMAPEQCDPPNLGELGPPADLWGLGVSLFYALSGGLPFPPGDEDSIDLLAQYPQLQADPRPLPGQVPQPLAEAVLGCLEKDPAKRPVASELATTLEALAVSVEVRPPEASSG
jgi:eukaryotic-like serine/threonine-protein kinase